MAYTPPPYNAIIFGEDEETNYTPPAYNAIVFDEDAADSGIGRYAIVFYENHMVTISSTLLGTGLQPIVMMPDGSFQTRAVAEGIPLTMLNDEIITLPAEDYILV